jgi:tetratricopeptide (TPR) repeat protein
MSIRSFSILLINFFFITFSFAQNQQVIDSLEKMTKTVEDEKKAEVYNHLAFEYLVISIDKSLNYSDKALKYAHLTNNRQEEINALSDIGSAFYSQNKYFEAIKYYQQSLMICKEINNEQKMADINNRIGKIYKNLSDYEKATEYSLKALEAFEKLYNADKQVIHYKEGIANTLNDIGLIYCDMGINNEALEYYKKSLKITQELFSALGKKEYKAHIASIINNIAIIYENTKDYEKALNYYNESLNIFNELNNKNGIAGALNNIGMLYFNSKAYEKALDYFLRSLEIKSELGSSQSISNTMVNIGAAYLRMNKYVEALPYFDQSLELAKKVKARNIISQNYLYLSELFSAKGNTAKAFDYYKQYSALEDSIYNIETINKIADIQTRYKIANKEQEIQLQENKIKAQRNLIYFAVAISLIILIFSIIFFIQKIRQKRANKELVLKNIEIVKSEQQLLACKNELENAISVLNEKNIFLQASKTTKISSGYKLPDSHKQEILDKIINLFDKEKVFLQSDITIDRISKQLNTNRTYVSQVINDTFKKNFSDYLNEYRVKEALKLLSDPNYKHLTIEGIASEVGFAIPTTFYRCFKKYTGVSPAFYLKTSRSGLYY